MLDEYTSHNQRKLKFLSFVLDESFSFNINDSFTFNYQTQDIFNSLLGKNEYEMSGH